MKSSKRSVAGTTLLFLAQGAPGGIGRVELLLEEAWSRFSSYLRVIAVKKLTHPAYLGASAPSRFSGRGRFVFAARALINFAIHRPQVVVFSHINFVPLAALFQILRPATQYIVVTYGVDAWKKPNALARYGLKGAAQIWAISEYTKQELLRQGYLPVERVRTVHLALPPKQSADLTAEALLLPSISSTAERRVLCVSRLSSGEQKGIEHLLEAFALVLAAVPNAHLVVVGDGADRQRLAGVSDELGISQRVHFMGQIPDECLAAEYRACDIFVLPSAQEDFGLVFLEAMTAGKAVIAARAGASPELVEDGVTGLLTQYGSSPQMADAIIALLTDAGLRERMGSEARFRAATKFGFGRFLENVEGLITSLSASPKPVDAMPQ